MTERFQGQTADQIRQAMTLVRSGTRVEFFCSSGRAADYTFRMAGEMFSSGLISPPEEFEGMVSRKEFRHRLTGAILGFGILTGGRPFVRAMQGIRAAIIIDHSVPRDNFMPLEAAAGDGRKRFAWTYHPDLMHLIQNRQPQKGHVPYHFDTFFVEDIPQKDPAALFAPVFPETIGIRDDRYR